MERYDHGTVVFFAGLLGSSIGLHGAIEAAILAQGDLHMSQT